jgi:hypothetical protein
MPHGQVTLPTILLFNMKTWSSKFKNVKPKNVRDYEATAIVGMKRQGKTTLAKILIEEYISKYPNKRVLVYDVANAFGKRGNYKGIKKITIDEIINGKKIKGKRHKWIRGVRRIMFDPDMPHKEVLTFLNANFTDGAIFIDEATQVFGTNPTEKERALMYGHTNNRVDVYMIFHGLSKVPRSIRNAFWNYILFKTDDALKDWQDLRSMGFNNPKMLYEKLMELKKTPKKEGAIIQPCTYIKLIE